MPQNGDLSKQGWWTDDDDVWGYGKDEEDVLLV